MSNQIDNFCCTEKSTYSNKCSQPKKHVSIEPTKIVVRIDASTKTPASAGYPTWLKVSQYHSISETFLKNPVRLHACIFPTQTKTSGRDLGGWNSEYGIVNVMSVYTNTHTHISTKITGESYIICPSFGCGSTSLRHIHHSQVGSEAFP